MTVPTSIIAMLDHVGTHVDAFRHVGSPGPIADEMPLDMLRGKAIC